jgi:hypothetical protein
MAEVSAGQHLETSRCHLELSSFVVVVDEELEAPAGRYPQYALDPISGPV